MAGERTENARGCLLEKAETWTEGEGVRGGTHDGRQKASAQAASVPHCGVDLARKATTHDMDCVRAGGHRGGVGPVRRQASRRETRASMAETGAATPATSPTLDIGDSQTRTHSHNEIKGQGRARAEQSRNNAKKENTKGGPHGTEPYPLTAQTQRQHQPLGGKPTRSAPQAKAPHPPCAAASRPADAHGRCLAPPQRGAAPPTVRSSGPAKTARGSLLRGGR